MTEDAKEQEQLVTFRVPKPLLEAFDKTYEGSRADKFREVMRKEVATSGGKIPVSYEKLKMQADKHRQRMEQLLKNEKVNDVLWVVLKKESLQAEWIPSLIKDLINYPIRPNDHFNRYDLEDTIEYLEETLKLETLLNQIDSHRAIKFGITPEQPNGEKKDRGRSRYIPLEDLCDSGCDIYETREEHEIRKQKEREEQEADDRAREEREAEWNAEHPEDKDDED